MKLSLVIPAHNEEEGVRPTVERLHEALAAEAVSFEILVVNDHSSDGTEAVLQALAAELPGVRYVNNERPNGFGHAIQTGLDQFQGDAVCIVMADASDDPQDVVKYYHALEAGYECVFGSRFTRQSRVVDYPRLKLTINRLANLFIKLLFGLPFNDITNAFKAYRREVIEGLRPMLSPHFNITVELPLKAIVRGYTYTTMPINWYNRETGVSKLKIKEMGSRYLFIVLYVWLEKALSRGDYHRVHGVPGKVPAPAFSVQRADGTLRELATAVRGGVMGGTAVLDMDLAPTRTSPALTAVAVATPPGPRFEADRLPPAPDPGSTVARRRTFAAPRWLVTLGVMALAWAVIVARRPDAIFNAQFWAEDGRWYSQAYNVGPLSVLFVPTAGYLNVLPRLVALIALGVPLAYAPLVFNTFAILIQMLPAIFVLSGRFDTIIPSRATQYLLAFLYLALPNSFEINATITNTQWHLIILAFMVIVARPPSSRGAHVFDAVTLILSGLSGPFCLLLVPIIALRWLQTRSRYTLWLFVANLFTALAQIITLLGPGSSQRVHPHNLGADPINLARLVSGQIVLGSTIGMNGYAHVLNRSVWGHSQVPIAIACLYVLCLMFALWKGPIELKLFVTFGALVYATALVAPLTSGTTPAWVVMTLPGAGARYEYVPMLAFVATLVWLASTLSPTLIRPLAAAVLGVMLIVGIPADWQYPPFQDLKFSTYAAQFEALPAGQTITIPINPDGWSLTLQKH